MIFFFFEAIAKIWGKNTLIWNNLCNYKTADMHWVYL